MPNMRIIYDNAADRANVTSLSAASTAVSAVNMQKDNKSSFWRSANSWLIDTITVNYLKPELIGGVVLAFTNLTCDCKIKLIGYSSDNSIVYETDWALGAPPTTLGDLHFGDSPLGFNTYNLNPTSYTGMSINPNAPMYAYGGGSYIRCWVPMDKIAYISKLDIRIYDVNNSSGYLEVCRLITGMYWSPKYNVPFGLPITNHDASTNTRSDSGNLVTQTGTKHRSIQIDLTYLTSEDSSTLGYIIRNLGVSKSFFISVFPEDADVCREAKYQLYGKNVQLNPISFQNFLNYDTAIEIEEI